VIVNLSLVPSISSTQIIEVCPFLKVVLPPTKSPVRISGPFVSNKIATFVDNSLLISNNVVIFSACSSCVPCEKFNLMTFIPAFTNFVSISLLSDAGPTVHTIFVFDIISFFFITFAFLYSLQF